jgi:iron complex outermembrane recepter protein
MLRSAFLLGCACLALSSHAVSLAQDAGNAEPANDDITRADEIVVLGQIGYRDRAAVTEPVLQYDAEFFQRFEPLTAGDALKRVPSVTFLSDVIESDGARLRGLPPGYTQILINGEKVPGSNADRSFFMDRIPAELISSVEIVRSASARRTGDAVAGSLNIVLRDAYQLDGGYVRGGALRYDDGEFEPSFGAVFGTQAGPGRLLLGANLQGRHNPKLKSSLRYGDSPENEPDYVTDEFDNREDQTDTRDGKDYSFNGSYRIEGSDTDLQVNGFYVRTDRTEDERSFEYEDATAISGPVPGGALLTDNANVADIDQENYAIDGKLSHDWSLGKTSLRLGYAQFKDERYETEYEIDFEDAEFAGEVTDSDILDKEFSIKLEHEVPIATNMDFVFGGFLQDKDRRSDILTGEQEDDFSGSWNQFARNPTELAVAFGNLEAVTGGLSDIAEKRRDVFALVEGKGGGLSWEIGLRYETTKIDITDREDPTDIVRAETDYEHLLPSASLKWNVTDHGRFILSGARTVRRPDFNFISPALLEEEVGDSDLLGNPLLEPEKAWGFDIGYEQRIGRRGIVGINFFYRAVDDLIELVNTGDEGSEGPGTWVYQPRNIGDGKVYGIEFDLSTDLGFIGLPDTGLFGNASWLDSEVTDFMGSRRFNDQSEYVYNFGFIQDLPSVGAAFGATYRKQGSAFGRVIAEEVKTSYGADLEIFAEKRFGKNFTIRAVGSNLLNGRKDEIFNKFDNLDDQIARKFDEYELESEKAGPFFQIMARYAF